MFCPFNGRCVRLAFWGAETLGLLVSNAAKVLICADTQGKIASCAGAEPSNALL